MARRIPESGLAECPRNRWWVDSWFEISFGALGVVIALSAFIGTGKAASVPDVELPSIPIPIPFDIYGDDHVVAEATDHRHSVRMCADVYSDVPLWLHLSFDDDGQATVRGAGDAKDCISNEIRHWNISSAGDVRMNLAPR